MGGGVPSPERAPFGASPARDGNGVLQWRVSEDADLLPSPLLVLEEADEILEEWFAGGAEQAAYTRLLGGARSSSDVVEIGCGLGRLAFALRRTLIGGSYVGVDVREDKISFLNGTLGARAVNFSFAHIDMRNGFYNRLGEARACRLPCADASTDVVVAMAVFTHLLPDAIESYFDEASRILRRGGRLVLSCYLLDFYRPDAVRPAKYSAADFAFDHEITGVRAARTSDRHCPEHMLAYELRYLEDIAMQRGLEVQQPVLPGAWSGSTDRWLTGQDLLVFERCEP